jgi:hypothetical protein
MQAGHESTYIGVIGEHEEKERVRGLCAAYRRENNIKVNLKEIGCGLDSVWFSGVP